MTTAIAIPSPALDWLNNNIKPMLSGNRKRLAFRFTAMNKDFILTADSTGRTTPAYLAIDDDGNDPVDVGGKPTAIIAPPDNLDNFELLFEGEDAAFPSDDELNATDMEALQAEVVASLTGGDDFEGRVKVVNFQAPEAAPAPSLIPMPEPVKRKKGGKKAEAAPKSFRQKILDKLCDELGVAIPDPEVMFKKFKDNPAVTFVSFKKLAACNHPGKLMINPRGEFAKGLAEIMGYHNDNNIRNILNLSAEIDPNRVLALVATLLRYGRLIHCLEAATITDAVPHSATMNAEGNGTEKYDATAYQVWTGRHRAWALAFIYGVDVELPVMLSDMEFRNAAEECVESNKSRPMGKAEQIHYEQIQRSLTLGDSPASQFASLKGDQKKIANFVVYHTHVQPDSDVFVHPTHIEIGVKRTPRNITLPFYRSAIEFALTSAGMNSAVKLDAKSVKGINNIVTALDALFSGIEQEFALDAERKLVWTYYSAGAFGTLLGEKLRDGNSPEQAAAAVLNMITGMFKAMDTETAKDKLAKEPPASLSNYLLVYDELSEEAGDEDLADGILS